MTNPAYNESLLDGEILLLDFGSIGSQVEVNTDSWFMGGNNQHFNMQPDYHFRLENRSSSRAFSDRSTSSSNALQSLIHGVHPEINPATPGFKSGINSMDENSKSNGAMIDELFSGSNVPIAQKSGYQGIEETNQYLDKNTNSSWSRPSRGVLINDQLMNCGDVPNSSNLSFQNMDASCLYETNQFSHELSDNTSTSSLQDNEDLLRELPTPEIPSDDQLDPMSYDSNGISIQANQDNDFSFDELLFGDPLEQITDIIQYRCDIQLPKATALHAPVLIPEFSPPRSSEVVQYNNAEATPESTPVKRRPGRPRKTDQASQCKPSTSQAAMAGGESAPVKRRPGRPRKTEQTPQVKSPMGNCIDAMMTDSFNDLHLTQLSERKSKIACLGNLERIRTSSFCEEEAGPSSSPDAGYSSDYQDSPSAKRMRMSPQATDDDYDYSSDCQSLPGDRSAEAEEKRRKNNEASKKSRNKRKEQDKKLEEECEVLQKTNDHLKRKAWKLQTIYDQIKLWRYFDHEQFSYVVRCAEEDVKKINLKDD